MRSHFTLRSMCHFLSKVRHLILIFLSTVVLIWTMPPIAVAQSSPNSADLSTGRSWWDLAQARPCGRMWCSDVITEYTSILPGEPKITLAVKASIDQKDHEAAAIVESRSSAVGASISRLVELSEGAESNEGQEIKSLRFWLKRNKGRHPGTPRLGIGIRSNNTVVYIPENKEAGLPQATLLTVTEDDALANGKNTQTLASSWQALMETTVSNALWGQSFEKSLPLARPIAAMVTLLIGLLCIVGCSRVLDSVSQQQRRQQNLLWKLRERKRKSVQSVSQDMIWIQRIERRRTIISAVTKAITFLEVAILAATIVILLFLFPATRLSALFLLVQSASIPVIWLGMIGLETILTMLAARQLNIWALNAQSKNPRSYRPMMRLATASRAVNGSIGIGTTLLGIYLVVLSFDVRPQVLAGAGILAVGLGFLARSLIEDLLGGLMILTSDLFAIGDVIRVDCHQGLVETMNLMRTQLRGGGGALITIPNGSMKIVENLSKDWARVEFEIDISWSSDIENACVILERTAMDLVKDNSWGEVILEHPTLRGVQRLDGYGVRIMIWIKTKPLKQWDVGCEYRRRVKHALDSAGIQPGVPSLRLTQP